MPMSNNPRVMSIGKRRRVTPGLSGVHGRTDPFHGGCPWAELPSGVNPWERTAAGPSTCESGVKLQSSPASLGPLPSWGHTPFQVGCFPSRLVDDLDENSIVSVKGGSGQAATWILSTPAGKTLRAQAEAATINTAETVDSAAVLTPAPCGRPGCAVPQRIYEIALTTRPQPEPGNTQKLQPRPFPANLQRCFCMQPSNMPQWWEEDIFS